MKNTHFIAGDEVLAAIRNWDRVMNQRQHPYPNHHTGPHRFNTFIGPHELMPSHYSETQNQHWGWKVSELAYNKIKILASPHHYALLKAFKARTGWQGIIP